MNIQLIKGVFTSIDALELIEQMINKKIKFHENKISKTDSQEDIKYRESKIKQLQNQTDQLKKYLKDQNNKVQIDSTISISPK